MNWNIYISVSAFFSTITQKYTSDTQQHCDELLEYNTDN